MSDDGQRTRYTWSEATAALKRDSSLSAIFALWAEGGISSSEVLDLVCEHCYWNPERTAELLKALAEHPDEAIRKTAGGVRELLKPRS